MIFGVDGVDPERRRQLVQLLDIDLYQRMTTMSDGQRRRVQICMGLLKPYDVSRMRRAAACGVGCCL
jgi:CCR4-NOT complex subunit CAF16